MRIGERGRIQRRGLLLGFGALGAFVTVFGWMSTDADAASRRSDVVSTRVLDRHGVLLEERLSAISGYGTPVALSEVSPHLVAATLAGEDQNFYQHLGVDPEGVLRALWLNARGGKWAYGGSTITQQWVKLLDPSPRTLLGKIREALGAFRIELTMRKSEILEGYLNRAYYGRNAYGVEAASRRFFGKHAKDLTLDEAALLAILPRGPSRYRPDRHPREAMARRAHVLDLMVAQGSISAEEAEAAKSKPIALTPLASGRKTPHLLDWLALTDAIPAGAVEARTTIDLALQTRVEDRMRLALSQLRARGISQMSVVVVDNRTAEVRVLAGSADYDALRSHGAVNGAVAIRRPGSTLKPFLYAMAIEEGAYPGTPVFDVPTTFRGYAPRSLHGKFRGVVPMREALASSLNVPATRLAGHIGPDRFVRFLTRAGLRTVARAREPGVAAALGAVPTRLIELAEGYATLAKGGVHRRVRVLQGEPLSPPSRVMSDATAYLVSSMLADPIARRREFGFETPLDLPFPVAAKTGTSQGYADNVVVGYTPEITVAVWAGNFDGTPTRHVLAMDGAAPLFAEVMELAMRDRPKDGFARPASVISVDVCPISGMLAGPHCGAHVREEVAVRFRPSARCDWHSEAGLSLPAEVQAFSPTPQAGALADPERPIRILSPNDGGHFVRDPALPAEAQGLVLRAAVAARGVTQVRWFDNDVPIGIAAAPFHLRWSLAPGTHRLRATIDVGSQVISDEIGIVVDGEEP